MEIRVHRAAAAGLLAAAGVAVACQTAKSANPLTPTVAGPIPGVTITAPRPLEPGAGWQLDPDQPPLTLIAENAQTTGQRPLSYTFEVATDLAFASRIFTRENVAQGDGGRTTVRMSDPLANGRTYYWRVKAYDGANTGPYSAAANFGISLPIVIEAPALLSPINGVAIDGNRPTFRFRNANRSGPVGALAYAVQVSGDQAFTQSIVASTPEQPNETSLEFPNELPFEGRFFWRVRASDQSTSSIGPWSATQHFATPRAPAPAPQPGPGDPGPPPGPGPDITSCESIADKQRLVECVHSIVNPARTVEGAFEVTKRVAWALRREGAGLLIKNGGENIVSWKGYSFSASRVCYPDGHIYKVLTDVPATNGPSWQDNDFVDRSLYVPAINPNTLR
jgi:hypothetical protein